MCAFYNQTISYHFEAVVSYSRARRLLIGVTEDSKASMEESRNESPVNRKYKPECEPDRNFDNPSLLLPKLKNIIHKSSIFSLYLIKPFNVAKNFNNPIIVIT